MKIGFFLVTDGRSGRMETVSDDSADTRTHKVFRALDEICLRLDLSRPIWLDVNVREFQERARTRFSADNFVEEVPFSYLQMQVLKEDE